MAATVPRAAARRWHRPFKQNANGGSLHRGCQPPEEQRLCLRPAPDAGDGQGNCNLVRVNAATD